MPTFLTRAAGAVRFLVALLGLAGCLSLGPTTVVAAQEPATETETPTAREATATEEFTDEIVVTARRKQENLQQVPVSVTAFSQSTLEQRSATRLEDLAELTPNLTIGLGSFGNDSSEAVIYIRGIGQNDTAVFSDPAVGVYLDGIYLARAQGGLLDLVDMERIEILRGPQGTLFGKNTTGGAIQLITRRPEREFTAKLSATVGNYHRLDGHVSVDGELGDDLYGSLAYTTANADGWSRSLQTGREYHDDDRDLLRASLEWAPERGWQAFLTADYLQDQGTGGNPVLVRLDSTPILQFLNQVLGDSGQLQYTDAFAVTDIHTSNSAGPEAADPFVDGEVFGITLDLSRQVGRVLFRSLTGYRDVDYTAAADGDGTPVQVAEVVSRERQEQISQEFQLQGAGDRADWTVGAIYFQERPENDETQQALGGLFEGLEAAPGAIYAPPGVPNVLCNPGPPPPGLPCFGGAGNPLNFAFFFGDGIDFDLDLENESWAVFGESTWHATDRLSVTLGGRWTDDRKSFSYLTRNGFGMVDNDLFAEDSWSDWSGRLSLAFQANPDTLVFGNLSRGFKSGGFNGRPQDRGVLDAFDPEVVVSTELGVKSDLLDRRLRVNASVFASDYSDIHFAASLEGPAGQPVFVTQNAGEADIQGFELETELHPGAGWVLSSTVGHLDTELTTVDPRVPEGVDPGNQLPWSPEWTASVGIQKAIVLGGDSSLIVRADYSWTDDFYLDLANAPGIAQDAYSLLSARLTYGPYSGRYELALFGTNLTDEDYLASGFVATAFGPSLVIAAPPRQYGASVSLRF